MGKKKIRVENKVETVKSSKKMFVISGIIVGLLVIAFIFMAVESAGKNKLTIENRTSHDISKLSLHYASPDTGYESEVFFKQAIAAGETVNSKTPNLELFGMEARLMTDITFDGEEMVSYDNGYFNVNFYGKTKIVFEENEDGIIVMTVKTKEGLFGVSNNNNECNETWEIKFK